MKFAATLALIAIASTSADHAVRESRPHAQHPASWDVAGTPSPEDGIKLSFYLKHSKLQAANLEAEFTNRSDPQHEDFGKWLSNDEVRKR